MAVLVTIAPKLNSILLPQFTDTLNIYPPPVYQVLNVNWSTFLKGILPTLLSHRWNNGTHGGCHLGSGALYLLPLAMWPTGMLLATVWVGIMAAHEMSQMVVLPPSTFHPPHSVPLHPAQLPIPPTPLLLMLAAERDGKNTLKFSHQR